MVDFLDVHVHVLFAWSRSSEWEDQKLVGLAGVAYKILAWIGRELALDARMGGVCLDDVVDVDWATLLENFLMSF